MIPTKNVAIAPDLLEQADRLAQAEGKTVDEFASQALRREIGRRTLEKIRTQGDARRRGKTDEEVEALVDDAVHRWRAEQRR